MKPKSAIQSQVFRMASLTPKNLLDRHHHAGGLLLRLHHQRSETAAAVSGVERDHGHGAFSLVPRGRIVTARGPRDRIVAAGGNKKPWVRAEAYLPSRTCRSLRAKPSMVNGFGSSSTPGSKRPPWTMALRAYRWCPALSPGTRCCACCARTRPLNPGNPTSVNSRAMSFCCSRMRSAAAPSAASNT